MLSKAKAKAGEAKAAAKAQAGKARRASIEGGLGVEISFLEQGKEVNAEIAPRNIVKSGWLFKAGGVDGKKGKKKRFFTVGDFALAYYDKELSEAKGGAGGESAQKHLKGTMDLADVTEVGPSDAEPFEFNLVTAEGRLLRVFGETDLDRKEWLLAIESFTQYTISRAASMERLSAAAAQLKLKLQALSSGLAAATAAAAAAPAGVQGVFPPKPASIAGNEECADRPIYTRPSPRTQP